MLNDRVKTTVELIGLFAVVASLLLVAYEVRQSNRIAQATTTYELGRDINQFNELGYSDVGFAALLIELTKDEAELTEVQALQARLLAHRFVNIWTTQETAYKNGLLTSEQFAATKRDVVTVKTEFPGLSSDWEHVFASQPSLRELGVLRPLLSSSSE